MERKPVCKGCGKLPRELDEYADMAAMLEMSADEYVRVYETNMHPFSMQFLCTLCFVRAGYPVQPSQPVRTSGVVARLS